MAARRPHAGQAETFNRPASTVYCSCGSFATLTYSYIGLLNTSPHGQVKVRLIERDIRFFSSMNNDKEKDMLRKVYHIA